MQYNNIHRGIFLDRPNRFVAHVEIDGIKETVHVKNTGRCREILIPGTTVLLEMSDNPARKTRYDLVAAYKPGFGLINIDSQATNKVAAEWLSGQDYSLIRPEYTYGGSRIDFYMEKETLRGTEKYLMEVKGCTLERDGTGYFPDAPTERGIKHLHKLAGAVSEGYHCILAFVIQMNGITKVRPNLDTHPQFGAALAEAEAAGVQVLFLSCRIQEDGFRVVQAEFGHSSEF